MTISPQPSGGLRGDMRETLPAPSHSIQTLNHSSVSPPSFLSLDGVTLPQELGLSPRDRRAGSRWGNSVKLALCAVAAAAALAVLIASCASAYLRPAPLQLTRRRLSEGEPPESLAGYAACQETHGDGSENDPHAPVSEEDPGTPPAKRAKVEDKAPGADDDAAFLSQTLASGWEVIADAAAAAPETEPRMSPEEDIVAQALSAVWGEWPSAFLEQAAPLTASEQQAHIALLQQQVQIDPALERQAQRGPALQQQEQLGVGLEQQASPVLHYASVGHIVAEALSVVWGAWPPVSVEQATPLSAEAQVAPALERQAQLGPALEQQAQLGPAVKQRAKLGSGVVLTEEMVAQALSALLGAQELSSLEQASPGPLHEPAQLSPVPPQQGQLATDPQKQKQLPFDPKRQAHLAPAFQQQAQVSRTRKQKAAAIPSVASQARGSQPQPDPVQRARPHPKEPPKASHEASPASALEAPPQTHRPRISVDTRATFLSIYADLELIDPLGNWEPPSEDKAGGRVVFEHAFSRLPRVKGGDPSAYSPLINPLSAISSNPTPNIQARLLKKLRTMLAQEELSADQMRDLAALTERVLNHLTFNETEELPVCPSLAVATLGFRFILLDITVSSLQLLGVPRSGPWWDHVVSRIPDQYNRSFTRWKEDRAKFNVDLMIRLTASIRILKSGERPEPNVLVHIKRCLFCCRRSPIRFLNPGWDRWREDDRDFYGQFEGSQSSLAQPGPSHQSSS
ncbi:hypothetical protein Emed_004907 [Eimeria media]